MVIVYILIGAVIGAAIAATLVWLLREGDVKALKAKLDSERQHTESLRTESERQWMLKLEAIKNEMLNAASEQLANSRVALRQSNDRAISDMLRPLKDQFEVFRRTVEENSKQAAVNKQSIEDKFAETLRLMQLQQEQTISQLKAETTKIGNDAVNLARALKGNNKQQGNWGEMILQSMLEQSGLEEGRHFDVQYQVTDQEGHRNIPDVVVHFPEGRSVIIDSKVSLTAYTEYFETDDEERKKALLHNHLRSVQRHIDELSAKNYPRTVPHSMDYVLMFIPNESSYIAALKLDPKLLNEAYAKKVIVISPNNLVMALQLAYNLWQTDKQVKNINKIVEQGTKLYEKISTFRDTFEDLGRRISALQTGFDNANRQLYEGKGNVMRLCKQLEDYGVQPDAKKRLKDVE